MEPVEEKKKGILLSLAIDDPVLICSDFCTREVLGIVILRMPRVHTST